jgi:hypothetical protein
MNKSSMKTFKTQLRAVKIHQRIYNAKKEVLNDVFIKRVLSELNRKINKILKGENPSIEEIMVLRKMLNFDNESILKDLGRFYVDHEIGKTGIQKNKEIIEAYSSIEGMINRSLDEKLKNFKPKNKSGPIVYLSQDGDLYMEPKERHCYHMKSKLFFNILMSLDYEYKSTEDICIEVGSKNNPTLRKEIGKLKPQIKKHLGLSDFIESGNSAGYRISSRYIFVKP